MFVVFFVLRRLFLLLFGFGREGGCYFFWFCLLVFFLAVGFLAF